MAFEKENGISEIEQAVKDIGVKFLKNNQEDIMIGRSGLNFEMMSKSAGELKKEMMAISPSEEVFTSALAKLVDEVENYGYSKEEELGEGNYLITLFKGSKTASDKYMEESITRGLKFLEENKEEIVIRILSRGFSKMESESAKKLEAIIDEGGQLSGATFNMALKTVITKAEKLGYVVLNKEESNGDKIITLTK